MRLILLIKKILMLPFIFIKSIFTKKSKKNVFGDFEEDIKKLQALNLPINVVSVHFDEEKGIRYDITSTQQAKALERATNEKDTKEKATTAKSKSTTAKKKETKSTESKETKTKSTTAKSKK